MTQFWKTNGRLVGCTTDQLSEMLLFSFLEHKIKIFIKLYLATSVAHQQCQKRTGLTKYTGGGTLVYHLTLLMCCAAFLNKSSTGWTNLLNVQQIKGSFVNQINSQHITDVYTHHCLIWTRNTQHRTQLVNLNSASTKERNHHVLFGGTWTGRQCYVNDVAANLESRTGCYVSEV